MSPMHVLVYLVACRTSPAEHSMAAGVEDVCAVCMRELEGPRNQEDDTTSITYHSQRAPTREQGRKGIYNLKIRPFPTFRNTKSSVCITCDQSPSVLQSSTPFSRMLCLSRASSAAVHVTSFPKAPSPHIACSSNCFV